jgi:uncharacterized protein
MWKATSEGIVIPIKVLPKASRNAIIGWENGELKIRIAAPPEKGSANEELLAFLSDELGISKSQIKLLYGANSRHKRLCISNIDPSRFWFLKTES